jgi:transcriptional regulator with XRE-family HTH domain
LASEKKYLTWFSVKDMGNYSSYQEGATMSEAAVQLGRKIRTLRDALGMTQEKLAEEVNISLKHFGEIERGRSNPTLITIVSLANALHVTPAELMAAVDEREPLDTVSTEIRALVEKEDERTRQRMLRVLKAMLAGE